MLKRRRPDGLVLFPLLVLFCAIACGEAATDNPADAVKDVALESPSRKISMPPVGPAEITLAINRELGAVELSWSSVNPGDYILDGAVSGQDVFPLAARFQETVAQTPGNECIDGNGDGALDGQDLFLVAANFQKRIDHYDVFDGQAMQGPWGAEPMNIADVEYLGCNRQVSASWPYDDGDGPWYTVLAWDEAAQEYGDEGDSAVMPLPPGDIVFNGRYLKPQLHIEWGDTANMFDTYNLYRSDEVNGEYVKLNSEPLNQRNYDDYDVERDQDLWYKLSTISEGEGIESLDSSPKHAFTAGWETFTVDEEGRVGQHCSSAITGEGAAWIAYHDDTNAAAKAVLFHQGLGLPETIETGDNAGAYISLALDGDETPWVAYQSGFNGLKVAERKASVWDIEEVDSDGGSYTSIAFDAGGDPGVSHHHWETSLRYAHSNGLAWTLETVDDTDNAGGWCDLAYDADDNPVISYRGANALRVAWFNGSDWDITVVDDSEPLLGEETCIAIGPDGQPWVSHFDRTNEDLRLSHFNGSTWDNEAIDSDRRSGMNSSLAFDSQGRPMIAYRAINPLSITMKDGGEWIVFQLPTLHSGIHADLLVDQDDRPTVPFWTGALDGDDLMLMWIN